MHAQRLPVLNFADCGAASTGVKKFFCGPESFTPDLAPCVGESPEIKNYFVAAGKWTTSVTARWD
jgi:glycine/D-amino acid oxidase-like deaminating enzyme